MTAMTATRNGWKPRDFVRDDRVHRTIYSNPEIFDLEMERIFERVWVYVGHESQVPNPGDFFCTTIGRQPVVMVRHQDEQVYVLYNRCGHRAALVCNEDSGNTRHFRCAYHGWTFRTNGELAGAPMRNGYPEDFDWTAPELGMVQLPRVSKYGGFVFASMAPDGPDLESYLGAMTSKIDDVLNLSPQGEIELVGGALKYGYRANWKLQLDNAMDLYHPPFSHESTSSTDGRQFTRRVGDERGIPIVQDSAGASATHFFDKVPLGAFDAGHAWCGSIAGDNGARTGEVFEEYAAALAARHGHERLDEILNPEWHNAVVYPNCLIQSLAQYVRVVRPVAADRTEVHVFPYQVKGAPKEWNAGIIKYINITHGPGALIQGDDVESFMRIQTGVAAKGADWIILARGLGEDVPDPAKHNQGGMVTSGRASELPQRNFYRAWCNYLEAGP